MTRPLSLVLLPQKYALPTEERSKENDDNAGDKTDIDCDSTIDLNAVDPPIKKSPPAVCLFRQSRSSEMIILDEFLIVKSDEFFGKVTKGGGGIFNPKI